MPGPLQEVRLLRLVAHQGGNVKEAAHDQVAQLVAPHGGRSMRCRRSAITSEARAIATRASGCFSSPSFGRQGAGLWAHTAGVVDVLADDGGLPPLVNLLPNVDEANERAGPLLVPAVPLLVPAGVALGVEAKLNENVGQLVVPKVAEPGVVGASLLVPAVGKLNGDGGERSRFRCR